MPAAVETTSLPVQHVFRLHDKDSLTSGFHPKNNELSEQANQALEAALRCVTSSNKST